jgi:hypothetical protein
MASVATARGDRRRALDLAATARDLYSAIGYQLTLVERADLEAIFHQADTDVGSATTQPSSAARLLNAADVLVEQLLGDDADEH